MTTIRDVCVLCLEKKFVSCFDIINTINIVESLDSEFNENEINYLDFIGCKNCGCVQLKNLFDPELIYNQASHFTESGVWIKHNDLFVKFIDENISKNKNIIEIGGGSGRLAKNILNSIKKISSYKILDISVKHIDTLKDIEYIEGNCESFDFNNTNAEVIILSHVFEHLYEPKKFIKNIGASNISEVFISIPDMENLTNEGDINNLHIQHTFYIDTNFITGLFKEYNFDLKNIFNYEHNSVFYHFVKNDLTYTNKTINDYKNVAAIDFLKNFYANIKNKIMNFTTNELFFICPSGFYGKIIYHYMEKSVKEQVIGFLDSDKHKINKRLSATKCPIYGKEYIKNFENINVLIIAEKYKNEIVEELLSYNNSINFIFLPLF